MRCRKCGIVIPNQSKFCGKCGTPGGVHLQCPQCGQENPRDSVFCVECGEELLGIQKPLKGTQRKCKSCGHFNELDVPFCVACDEETTAAPQKNQKGQPTRISYKTIAIVIGLIFLLGIAVKFGTIFLKENRPSKLSVPSAPTSTPMINVDEAKVIAVAKNFKCACGGCGELPLETCNCDMPRGSVEEKNFIREKLAEGRTVEQIIELLDKEYGHRVKG
jgi:cytochrome c-type biogenesis protein CcmH/NrfF